MSEPTPVRTDVVGGIPQLSLSVPTMEAVFDLGVATSTSSIEAAARSMTEESMVALILLPPILFIAALIIWFWRWLSQ
ncbi:hypothetical protein SLA2020_381370 [Shorea laevis]